MKRKKAVSKTFINKIVNILSSKKAENIKVIDTSRITSEFDYMVIASADNKYHIEALSDEIERFIYENNLPVLAKDINPETGWIIIDLFHTIIHIMTPEIRNYYNLERIWEIPELSKLGTT